MPKARRFAHTPSAPSHRGGSTNLAGVFAACTLAGAMALPALAANELPATAQPVADQAITAAYLRGTVGFLADDLLEGRGPGSRGDALTRTYLAQELASLGLEPGNRASYHQPFTMVGITAELPPTWTFRGAKGQLEAKALEQYVANSGTQTAVTDLPSSELVFVGYGITAPEHQWDDFKGFDLRGKVLVMLNNDPDWDDQLFEGKRRLYYGRWTYKYESAAAQGAAGAIIIHTEPSAGYGWNVVRSSWGGTQFELPTSEPSPLRVKGWLTEEVARQVLALSDHDLGQLVEAAKRRDFRPVPLGVETTLRFTNRLEQVETGNVLALLPGSDPALADEVVVYTAHHDHLGVAEPNAEGDAIYNGARDNAAGTAAVLAIARAFTALPPADRPRRSVLFLLVAAEEQGLLGSEHYARNPTFPPGKIAANVNLDAPGIWGRTRDVTYIGYGKSSLDAVIETVAKLQGRVVRGDQAPDRGSFYRSDQFSFARIGVPALYIDNGTELLGKTAEEAKALMATWDEQHYHQASDELDASWDFSGMVEDSQLAFLCGLLIANRVDLPHWNPGDEFAAARQQALDALGAATAAGQP
jgi:Zn-dependent M28 family amino/carboxypeptidase